MARKKKRAAQATTRTMFQRVLVANRGLIAANCVRAIKELGATAIVVYEEGDRDSAGVRNADEAYLLRQSDPNVRPYLDINQLIDIAQARQIDAVHPGYGFLAQSAEFASRLAEAGITFLGTTGAVDLACKPEVLAQAGRLGIRTLSHSERLHAHPEAKKAAAKLGYPLVVKPAYGFGGVGVRIVRSDSELEQACEHIATLAEKFLFPTSEVYLETFLDDARHIEFPLLRDSNGHTIVFPEVESTLQRRCQKFMVETPVAFLDANLRKQLESEVQVLADRLAIVGLASVEFLIKDGQAWFIEANGFVQPSHTATALLTGADMLRRQISILAGNPLRLTQEQAASSGHVVAAYIYAEDPEDDFAPSPGIVDRLHLPFGEGVFVQSSIFSGAAVSPYYDPKIVKVLARGATREETIRKLEIAMQEFYIEGVKSNIALLRAILGSDDFQQGSISLGWVEDEQVRQRLLASLRTETEEEVAALVAALAIQKEPNAQHILEKARQSQDASVWSAASRWLKGGKKKRQGPQ